MSLWPIATEWGGRLAVLTGLATPIYGGLAYFHLTPVTEGYVSAQISLVRKDTLETKRAVLGLARTDLIREREGLTSALTAHPAPDAQQTFTRRLEAISVELNRIDRTVSKLDDTIEDLSNK